MISMARIYIVTGNIHTGAPQPKKNKLSVSAQLDPGKTRQGTPIQ